MTKRRRWGGVDVGAASLCVSARARSLQSAPPSGPASSLCWPLRWRSRAIRVKCVCVSSLLAAACSPASSGVNLNRLGQEEGLQGGGRRRVWLAQANLSRSAAAVCATPRRRQQQYNRAIIIITDWCGRRRRSGRAESWPGLADEALAVIVFELILFALETARGTTGGH
jgi:hypothetical protein